MSARHPSVDDPVRVETPRGEPTVATVVEREPAGDVGTGPEDLLTVELDGVTWRVTGSEVDPLDED
ncbi:hypothetical protein [Haloparvum sedimenti]|uniref:hypothetical protein n=1 Tax=Haloparvum sedimenti TaxID=1678448 RepID=UPI00071E91F9|nr:hypothetical protein [Haloparvum sedimenti]